MTCRPSRFRLLCVSACVPAVPFCVWCAEQIQEARLSVAAAPQALPDPPYEGPELLASIIDGPASVS